MNSSRCCGANPLFRTSSVGTSHAITRSWTRRTTPSRIFPSSPYEPFPSMSLSSPHSFRTNSTFSGSSNPEPPKKKSRYQPFMSGRTAFFVLILMAVVSNYSQFKEKSANEELLLHAKRNGLEELIERAEKGKSSKEGPIGEEELRKRLRGMNMHFVIDEEDSVGEDGKVKSKRRRVRLLDGRDDDKDVYGRPKKIGWWEALTGRKDVKEKQIKESERLERAIETASNLSTPPPPSSSTSSTQQQQSSASSSS